MDFRSDSELINFDNLCQVIDDLRMALTEINLLTGGFHIDINLEELLDKIFYQASQWNVRC
jgi:hypothetical protein